LEERILRADGADTVIGFFFYVDKIIGFGFCFS